eukprot:19643-Eustigmatos_ZCMA.PRE.1
MARHTPVLARPFCSERSNLQQCLEGISYANAVIAAAMALKATKYDPSNPDHEVGHRILGINTSDT